MFYICSQRNGRLGYRFGLTAERHESREVCLHFPILSLGNHGDGRDRPLFGDMASVRDRGNISRFLTALSLNVIALLEDLCLAAFLFSTISRRNTLIRWLACSGVRPSVRRWLGGRVSSGRRFRISGWHDQSAADRGLAFTGARSAATMASFSMFPPVTLELIGEGNGQDQWGSDQP
jgi:hypothetical protein